MQKKLLSMALLFCLVSQGMAADVDGQNKSKCQTSFNQTIVKALSALGVKLSTQVMTDFANIKRSDACYFEAWPRDTKAVSVLVHFAYQHNIPMRVRGNGHSHNGSTLAQSSEILIRTDFLNTIKFEKPGEVTAGAGIPMDSINQYVRKNSDYELPVLNAAGIGPTLGGYISAGGISYTSDKYGGFWNHVREITLVVSNGEVKRITSKDPLFPWIFGSMGQFGIITEAKLTLIPTTTNEHPRYPLNKQEKLHYQHKDYFAESHQPVYWFNLFVNDWQMAEATDALQHLQESYPGVLNYIKIYTWSINNNRFVPPLLYPVNEDFYATGVWGTPGPAFDKQKLASMEKAFNELVIKHHFHRYIQAELFDQPDNFANYYAGETYQKFREIKLKLDPKFLFDTKTIFGK